MQSSFLSIQFITLSTYLAPNARINPRRAPATIYNLMRHHERDAIEASG